MAKLTKEQLLDAVYQLRCCIDKHGGSSGTITGTLKPWLYDTSGEEVVIGVYDGKPLYRKAFEVSVTCNAGGVVVYPLSDYVNDVESVLSSKGYIGKTPLPQLYAGSHENDAWPESHERCFIILIGSNGWELRFSFGIGVPASSVAHTIILEYTKTTDEAGSGDNLSLSCRASINYSTEEQHVGTWIDGKPLYQKVIEFGTLPNATHKDIEHGIADVEEIFISGGYVKSTSGWSNLINVSTPYALEDSWYFSLNNTYIRCSTGSDHTNTIAYVIVQYTKTTD